MKKNIYGFIVQIILAVVLILTAGLTLYVMALGYVDFKDTNLIVSTIGSLSFLVIRFVVITFANKSNNLLYYFISILLSVIILVTSILAFLAANMNFLNLLINSIILILLIPAYLLARKNQN